MNTLALTSTLISLSAATLFGQSQSDIEFLRARADAHERKISQLEQELIRLKDYHASKPAPSSAAKAKSAPASSSTASSSPTGSYVVKKGDILSRIAYRHKTSVPAIIKVNSLRSDRIYVGQKLRIPGASAPAAVPSSTGRTELASKPATAPVKSAATPSSGKHTVKKGETFYSIARDHKVSLSSLVASNPGVSPTRMHVGQTLVINGNAKASSSSASKSVAKSVAKSAPKAPVQKEAPPASSASSKSSSESAIRTITVNQQMTYGQFASRYGASTTQLNSLNGLSLSKNTMLAKGSELYVPKF